MKKITSLFLIIFIIFGMVFAVNAAENETEKKVAVSVSIDGPTSIEIGTELITLTIKLGAFTGIEENKPMGYEAVLNYNKNLIESVTVEGLNSWSAGYSKETQKITGDVGFAKANTQIAKVTFQLNKNLTDESDLGISFSKFNITDDDLLDQTLDLPKTITIKNAETLEEQKQETDGESLQVQNQGQQIPKVENKKTIKEINTDKTTSKSSTLPKAGLKTVVPLIVILAVVGIVFITRSKSIKLK